MNLEKEFIHEFFKRDAIAFFKIVRRLSDEEFKTLARCFLLLADRSDAEIVAVLDEVSRIKQMPDAEFESLIQTGRWPA